MLFNVGPCWRASRIINWTVVWLWTYCKELRCHPMNSTIISYDSYDINGSIKNGNNNKSRIHACSWFWSWTEAWWSSSKCLHTLWLVLNFFTETWLYFYFNYIWNQPIGNISPGLHYAFEIMPANEWMPLGYGYDITSGLFSLLPART